MVKRCSHPLAEQHQTPHFICGVQSVCGFDPFSSTASSECYAYTLWSCDCHISLLLTCPYGYSSHYMVQSRVSHCQPFPSHSTGMHSTTPHHNLCSRFLLSYDPFGTHHCHRLGKLSHNLLQSTFRPFS